MAFWALAGASLLGGAAQYFAGNEAADAQKDAARQNSQDQRYMFDRSVELSEPWRQAGMGALGEQYSLLGLSPQSAAPVSGGVLPGGGRVGEADYASYVSGNNDLQTAYNALSGADRNYIVARGYDANGDGRVDPAEYGKFHYSESGMSEGRSLPTFQAPTQNALATSPQSNASAGGADAQPGTAQDQAYDRFLDGGFARSMLETTNSDFDQMIGAFGAGGTAMSGATLGALNDRNRRNTNTAFTQHYNALGGMSGTGSNVAQNQGAQGIQLSNALAANNNQAAAAQGSSYMNAANAFGNVLGAGADLYSYGRQNGWFGGSSESSGGSFNLGPGSPGYGY